jgi:hypothetical protein
MFKAIVVKVHGSISLILLFKGSSKCVYYGFSFLQALLALYRCIDPGGFAARIVSFPNLQGARNLFSKA